MPLNESHQEEARSDAQQLEHEQHSREQVAPTYTEAQEEELNLFNILNEDVSDIGEDDPIN